MKYASGILIILIVSAVSFTSADILGKSCNEINQVEECGRFACYQNTNDTVTTCQICRTTKDCQNGNVRSNYDLGNSIGLPKNDTR